MDPERLIRIAGHLAAGGIGRRGRPHQTDLRRAVSAVYYALFHTLAAACANLLAGGVGATSSQAAWRQTYRALEHGHTRNRSTNSSNMRRFPGGIRDFAEMFVYMQDQRHAADYDPSVSFQRTQVVQMVGETRRTMEVFNRSPKREQRAFALYVLLRSRPD